MTSVAAGMSHDRPGHERLYATFRPRRARWVAYPLAAMLIVLLVVVALLLPSGESSPYRWWDRVSIGGVGVLLALGLHRLASVRAVPARDGLVVRNVFLTRRLEWAEVVGVRFGGGNPWVLLDLSDGDTLAVMGVQRADGDFAVAESRRLATLVAHHTRTSRND